jgi:hypothetical protein
MAKIQTLEDAVKEYDTANPKTPLMKEIDVETLSYKIMESDEGQIVDADSWTLETVAFKIYPEPRLESTFLSIRRSRFADRGFEVLIMCHKWIDTDHGFCVNQVDMTSEAQGISIARSKAKRLTASEASELLNDRAKMVWLRQREGTELKMPSVANFKLER